MMTVGECLAYRQRSSLQPTSFHIDDPDEFSHIALS